MNHPDKQTKRQKQRRNPIYLFIYYAKSYSKYNTHTNTYTHKVLYWLS